MRVIHNFVTNSGDKFDCQTGKFQFTQSGTHGLHWRRDTKIRIALQKSGPVIFRCYKLYANFRKNVCTRGDPNG